MIPPQPLTRPIVLVADDEPMMRSLLARILEPSCHVLIAADGRQALDLAVQLGSALRLIVTDIQMPHLDGLGLAARVRQLDDPPAILFISGNVLPRMVPGPLLTKPFPPEALMSAVDGLLTFSTHSVGSPL